ncbi:MAG: hypothetical protein L0211_11480 [Planctomycetaceae bacterium]|nr:hypothetical protein [Planctomycetaceae bacterium]
MLNVDSIRWRTAGVMVVVFWSLGSGGCGERGAAKGKVMGKVVFGGQPVTAGSLLFAPAEGVVSEPATGVIQPDGSFVMTTLAEGDGAAIGKHLVNYNAPPRTGREEWDGYGTPPPEKISPFEGLAPKQSEIEIKPGVNNLTIELVQAPPQPF